MNDYTSKEAVLELLCRECAENCTGGTPYRCYVPCAEWMLINALPPADVVPVVRCKNCKHYKDGWCYNPNTYDDEKTRGNTSPDWYCADGERRE